jgi:hypothetical protein
MSKHYNAAHVWGRIAEVPTEKKSLEGKGAPYLRLKLNCYNPEYGNVQAYGNLWGRKKIDECVAAYKKDPQRTFKFSGFVSQAPETEGHGRYTNFTFIGHDPGDQAAKLRAVFILVGEVTGIEGDKLALHLAREMKPKKEGDEPKIQEEDFDLVLLDRNAANGITVGDVVEVKGKLRARDGEDEYGSNSSPVRPYVEKIEVRIDRKDPWEKG